METRQNFLRFIKPLYLFDCMLSGMEMNRNNKPEIESKDLVILDKLIKHKLFIGNFINKYPKYINTTFDAFANHKTQIVLNLHFLDVFFSKMVSLITTNKMLYVKMVNIGCVMGVFC